MVEPVAVDVETTGLHPATDRILEIGVVRADAEGHVLKRFETLLNPERDVGPTDPKRRFDASATHRQT